jgi:hypothetical protein
MEHTIDAGEACAAALVAMGIKLLLGENVTACLEVGEESISSSACFTFGYT